jgi:hypothetical protein
MIHLFNNEHNMVEFRDWARRIRDEVDADAGDWFWPKSGEHQIFEQAYMKFLNGNLNYFSFENMVAQTVEGNTFHAGFPQTLEFCRLMRNYSSKYKEAPFGRMCVWKMPAGSRLLPHKDNFFYHRFVNRNIFVFSENTPGSIRIRICEKEMPTTFGTAFQFNPDSDLHEFVNDDTKPLYFLGFDFWMRGKLQALLSLIDPAIVAADPRRGETFTGVQSKAKYISHH